MSEAFLKRQEKLNIQQAICIALAFTIATAISFLYNTNHSYWIPMTVGILYATPLQGKILVKSYDRIIGTIFGVMFNFFYLETLMRCDYRWVYLLPVIFFALLYIYNCSSNYVIFIALLTIFLPLMYDISGTGDFSIRDVLVKRVYFTVIGIVIVLICDFSIFKYASLTTRHVKFNTRNYFYHVGEIVDICREQFIYKKISASVLRSKVSAMMKAYSQIENLYTSFIAEYDYEIDRKELIIKLLSIICKLEIHLKKLVSLAGYTDYNDKIANIEEFNSINNDTIDKCKHTIKYIYGKNRKDYLSKIISENSQKISATVFYLEELNEINKLLDSYIDFSMKLKEK